VLHAEVLAPSCAIGLACHADADVPSGLDLSDRATAELALAPYAPPGRPECSELVLRITSVEPGFRMPPAVRLTAEQQCAILAWARDRAP
jgi:hypothetical protein